MKKGFIPTLSFLIFMTMLGGIALLATAKTAHAGTYGWEDDEIVVADAKPLSDSDLSTMRAGFADPTGLIFRFAVDVKTRIDGAITFTRSILMMPNHVGQLAATSNSVIETAPTLPTGTVANVVSDGRGIEVTDSNGTTTVLNQTTSGALASVVMNTADNRQVTQTMDINIILQGVRAVIGRMSSNINSINSLAMGGHLHSLGFGH